MNSAQTFARNAETVRTLGMMRATRAHWGASFGSSVRASDRLIRINASYSSVSRAIRILIQIAMYGIGAYLTLKNEMTAGMIFAASMVSARALQPLDQIVGSWKQILDASVAWRRIRSFMDEDEKKAANRTELPAPAGGIAAEDVIYFLPNGREGAPPLIKRVGFAVGAGETLAIIGPSQAGKSTLARLLVGAIEPRSGCVRLGGADIRNWDPEKLGPHIGYLPQEVELFPGTIAQNVARFDAAASSEEIIAAGERARAHRMILAQRDGYDTPIGPMGVRLSGGEKQRVGLARAFYGDPGLIVLDEPNANLDNEGEAALEQAVLDAKGRGATVIVITHRLSIAAKCDRVLVLRDGQVEQIGPASEIFRRLAAAQAQASRQPSAEVVPMPTVARSSAGGMAQQDAN
jgi:ATP-binding cassette subfamily C protein